jgi:hypothetical protein
MYQELEMWKKHNKKKTMKIKFNHEHSASICAIAFLVTMMIVIVTFVN